MYFPALSFCTTGGTQLFPLIPSMQATTVTASPFFGEKQWDLLYCFLRQTAFVYQNCKSAEIMSHPNYILNEAVSQKPTCCKLTIPWRSCFSSSTGKNTFRPSFFGGELSRLTLSRIVLRGMPRIMGAAAQGV
jgi:hypothetical protein